MASPPCCPEGSHGAAPADAGHDPEGAWEEIAGMEVYVVGQKEGARSVLVAVSDVFGPSSGRHIRVCDEMARAVPGSLVVMPDLFHGNPIANVKPGPISFAALGMIPMVWRIRYRCAWENVWKDVEGLLEAVRARVGESVPMAAFGFCWGAWLVLKGSTTGRLAAGVGIHPSLKPSKLQCSPHNIDDESLARSLKCPVLLLPAGNDEATLKPGGAFLSAAQETQPASNSIEYAEMLHGWCSRGTQQGVDCVNLQTCSQGALAEAQASAVREAAAFLNTALGGRGAE